MTVIYHYLNENKDAINIAIIIPKKVIIAFTNGLAPNKTNTYIKLLFCKYMLKFCSMSDIDLIKKNLKHSYNISYYSMIFRVTISRVVHYHSCILSSI